MDPPVLHPEIYGLVAKQYPLSTTALSTLSHRNRTALIPSLCEYPISLKELGDYLTTDRPQRFVFVNIHKHDINAYPTTLIGDGAIYTYNTTHKEYRANLRIAAHKSANTIVFTGSDPNPIASDELLLDPVTMYRILRKRSLCGRHYGSAEIYAKKATLDTWNYYMHNLPEKLRRIYILLTWVYISNVPFKQVNIGISAQTSIDMIDMIVDYLDNEVWPAVPTHNLREPLIILPFDVQDLRNRLGFADFYERYDNLLDFSMYGWPI